MKTNYMSGKQSKKQIRKQFIATLTTTITALPGKISPKKLKRNIRKAGKVLVEGLQVEPQKEPKAKKEKNPSAA